jgi:hypothetical protein
VLYQGVKDTRACTPCSATYADNGCTGNLRGHSQSDCSDAPGASIRWGDNWTSSNRVYCYGGFDFAIENNVTVANPRCEASGGAPTGSIDVDPNAAITVCCAP